jgi:hypothetical protein
MAWAGTAARGEELLAMPFACTVHAGRPVLVPAQEQTYRIVGAREQHIFTACSPVDPNRCRHWMVHRFDVVCGAVRVSWPAIVAAASEHMNRRAWLEDGRLHVQMGRWWGMAPDDPCARLSPYDERWRYGRLGRYCADRRALAPPAFVAMPAGFAPMLGIPARFVPGPTEPPRESAPPPASPPSAAVVVPPKAARSETPQPPAKVAARISPPKEMPTRSEPPAAEAAAKPPVVPTIINRPEAPASGRSTPAGSAEDTGASVIAKTGGAEPSSRDRIANRIPVPPKAAELARASRPDREPAGEGDAPGALNVLTSSGDAIAGVVGLSALLIAAFVWARRRERERLAGLARRDIAAASLDGRSLPPVPRLTSGSPDPHRQPQNPPPPSSQPSWGAPPGWDNRLPTTRLEACHFLNVAPDASETAIKKIVDGLRMSWHPDLARSEPERQLRELRLKQINAAWDVITAGSRSSQRQ